MPLSYSIWGLVQSHCVNSQIMSSWTKVDLSQNFHRFPKNIRRVRSPLLGITFSYSKMKKLIRHCAASLFQKHSAQRATGSGKSHYVCRAPFLCFLAQNPFIGSTLPPTNRPRRLDSAQNGKLVGVLENVVSNCL